MKIVAEQYVKPWSVLPFIKYDVRNTFCFGSCRIEINTRVKRIYRITGADKVELAEFPKAKANDHSGWFWGSIESEEFTLTFKKKDFWSPVTGVILIDLELKSSEVRYEKQYICYDFIKPLSFNGLFSLKLSQRQDNHLRYCIEGESSKEWSDLAQVTAAMLLYINQTSPSD